MVVVMVVVVATVVPMHIATVVAMIRDSGDGLRYSLSAVAVVAGPRRTVRDSVVTAASIHVQI